MQPASEICSSDQLVADPVGDAAGGDADEVVALAAGGDAGAADAIPALAEGFEECGDVGGIVLQIGVHGHDIRAARGAQAGVAGGGFAAVEGELHAAHPRVFGDEGFDGGPTAVLAAVIDEDDSAVDACCVEDPDDGRVQKREIFGLVVDGNADAEVERMWNCIQALVIFGDFVLDGPRPEPCASSAFFR